MSSRVVKIKKGVSLPITGGLTSEQIREVDVDTVAILGSDFQGMKPSLLVKPGDRVKPGQPLFSCKKNIGQTFCSRFSGKVVDVHRGDKRAFQSIVIAKENSTETAQFKNYKNQDTASWSAESIRALLIESGEWGSLRQRPFEKPARVDAEAHSLFVTAVDTNPLAPHPKAAIEKWKDEFRAGLEILGKLPSKNTFVCFPDDYKVDVPNNCEAVQFSGPHPAGNAGTHIHFLAPVNMNKICWHIGYQDVIAVGHLFLTGQLMKEKLIGLVGPEVNKPELLVVPRGAAISEIWKPDPNRSVRVLSGSVFNGHKADGPFDFLGQYHNQVTALDEDNRREFLGWQSPGLNKFSTKRIFISKLLPNLALPLGTSTHGSKRAMVPIGMFENVMPLDILPTQLLRALVSNDIESAQDLGCLELGEEDLALCTFVSPGKVDFGPILRRNLETIEREG